MLDWPRLTFPSHLFKPDKQPTAQHLILKYLNKNSSSREFRFHGQHQKFVLFGFLTVNPREEEEKRNRKKLIHKNFLCLHDNWTTREEKKMIHLPNVNIP